MRGSLTSEGGRGALRRSHRYAARGRTARVRHKHPRTLESPTVAVMDATAHRAHRRRNPLAVRLLEPTPAERARASMTNLLAAFDDPVLLLATILEEPPRPRRQAESSPSISSNLELLSPLVPNVTEATRLLREADRIWGFQAIASAALTARDAPFFAIHDELDRSDDLVALESGAGGTPSGYALALHRADRDGSPNWAVSRLYCINREIVFRHRDHGKAATFMLEHRVGDYVRVSGRPEGRTLPSWLFRPATPLRQLPWE